MMVDMPPAPVAHAAVREITASSTAYTPCSSGTMTANGHKVRWGIVASNWHPFGTRIRLSRPVRGLSVFVVDDRIGHGTDLDIFFPNCRDGINYGRQVIRYRVVGR